MSSVIDKAELHWLFGYDWFAGHTHCESTDYKTSFRSELDPTKLKRVNGLFYGFQTFQNFFLSLTYFHAISFRKAQISATFELPWSSTSIALIACSALFAHRLKSWRRGHGYLNLCQASLWSSFVARTTGGRCEIFCIYLCLWRCGVCIHSSMIAGKLQRFNKTPVHPPPVVVALIND